MIWDVVDEIHRRIRLWGGAGLGLAMGSLLWCFGVHPAWRAATLAPLWLAFSAHHHLDAGDALELSVVITILFVCLP